MVPSKEGRIIDIYERCFHRPNKQTQFLQMPKMDVNVYVIEDYENETALRPKKTNPNKANFFKGQNELRAYPNNREIRNTLYEHRESRYLRAYKPPLHLSRTLYKSATFYAKQTQFKANFKKSQK